MGKLKEIAKEFIPPIAVGMAKRILHTIEPNARDSPFKYLPNNINPEWIMDIGANEGHVTISAMNAFPNANIICFEPVKETFKTLQINLDPYYRENLKRSLPRRIILRKVAISDFNGDAEINITTSNPANSLLDQNKCYAKYNPSVCETGKEKINVITLDSYIPSLPTDCKRVDIVKIDVEGLERNVINGGTMFFKYYVDMIIIEMSFQRETNPDDPGYLEIFNTLNVLGFQLINIFDVDNLTYDNPNIIDDTMVTQMDCIFRKRGGSK